MVSLNSTCGTRVKCFFKNVRFFTKKSLETIEKQGTYLSQQASGTAWDREIAEIGCKSKQVLNLQETGCKTNSDFKVKKGKSERVKMWDSILCVLCVRSLCPLRLTVVE